MFAKFQGNQRSIIISSINCLNSSFCSLKYCIKYEFIDRIVNNIWSVTKLACMLKIYRICNPTVRFSKYEFNNKLLGGVTLFRITPYITWTQPYIYIYSVILINVTLFNNFILDANFDNFRWITIFSCSFNICKISRSS